MRTHRSARSVLVTLTLTAALATAALAAPRMALAPGDQAPPLDVHAFPSGTKVSFDYGRHRLTVVNFWATWCTPCYTEMPALQRIYERRRDDELDVIGVYIEQVSWKRIYDAVTPLGITYQLAKIGRTTNADWGGIHSLPTTFLVDREGRIVRRYVGATEAQVEGMIADIDAYLDGRSLPPIVLPGSGGTVTGPGSHTGTPDPPAPTSTPRR